MLNRNDIKTVVVQVVNVETGETIEPAYEAYGYEKFLEFVDFHANLKSANKVAWVRGYGSENGKAVCLATKFVGIGGKVAQA